MNELTLETVLKHIVDCRMSINNTIGRIDRNETSYVSMGLQCVQKQLEWLSVAIEQQGGDKESDWPLELVTRIKQAIEAIEQYSYTQPNTTSLFTAQQFLQYAANLVRLSHRWKGMKAIFPNVPPIEERKSGVKKYGT